MDKRLSFGVFMLLCVFSISVSSRAVELKDVNIPNGEKEIKAGATSVISLCVACHSMKYIKYRNLLDIGFSKGEVDVFRGEKEMNDSFTSLMPAQGLKSSFGRVPPDLSMIAKVRKHGDRFLYSLLTGYYTKANGDSDNKVFPGIRMPDPLGYGSAADADKKQIEKTALDITSFLVWAADPHAQRRRTIGYWVLTYLFILTVLLYFLKQRVWAKLEPIDIATRNENG